MKILHIARDDFSPGANRAAYRLHKSLQNHGIDSNFLVAEKKTDDESVVCDKRHFRVIMAKVLEKISNIVFKKRKHSSFSFNWISTIIKDVTFYQQFDIIHIHWIGASTINIIELKKINNPVVWRLPDLFSFTGGCHYTEGCEKFTVDCSHCHLLERNALFDPVKFNFRKKYNIYKSKNLNIVSPSIWLYDLTTKAKLFNTAKKYYITTGVDTKLFSSMRKEIARDLLALNIPGDKKIILFGAVSSTSQPRKGFKYLEHALQKLDKNKYHFIVFGSSGNNELKKEFPNISFLGRFHDEVSMKLVYNTCDLMVVPSIEDNLPNTAIEAMGCAKPVVSFNIGGLPDLISHKKDGYIAKPLDSKDLARGIEWVLNSDNYEELCKNAREKIVRKFDSKIIAEKYIDLYKEVLNG